MSKKKTLENFRNEYQEVLNLATNYSSELVNQIEKLLTDNEINLGFPIQKRVKSWESIEEKLSRVQLNLKSLKELQDLVGIRIIVLFANEASQVCNILSDNFSVVKMYDTQERLKDDQFGYSSTHLIVKLPDEWLTLPSFKGMEELIAEIQVRTLSQHTWAETSHLLQYKQEDNVPSEVLRSIYRVSALLETVDLEFERVLDHRAKYRKSIKKKNQNLLLNVDLIEEILDSKFGTKRKSSSEPYSELLSELKYFGIKDSKDLNNFIDQYMDASLKIDSKRVDSELKNSKDGKQIPMEDPSKLLEGIFFSQVGLARTMLRQKFGDNEYRKFAGIKKSRFSKP